jgi:hypothetical protein
VAVAHEDAERRVEQRPEDIERRRLMTAFWDARQNLLDLVAPAVITSGASGVAVERPTVEPAVFLEAAWSCGAGLLRAYAGLVEAGEFESADPGAVVTALRERAAELDAAGIPDMAATVFDAGRYARDELGAFVWADQRQHWTWRHRLSAVQRFEKRHGGTVRGVIDEH